MRDNRLTEIDVKFAKSTGSRRSFTKECSPEIGIAVAPDEVYALWLEFLKAAERQALPALRRKPEDQLRRTHYRWMPATPYTCLKDMFRGLLSLDAAVRYRFIDEVTCIAGLKTRWSSIGLASWFNVLQKYRDALARHNTYVEYVKMSQAVVREAKGEEAVAQWDAARNGRVAFSFVPEEDPRVAFSDPDRARFIRGFAKSSRTALSAKGARANEWDIEAAGTQTYGKLYQNVLCQGKKAEENWYAPFVLPKHAPDAKLAGEYGRETEAVVGETEKELSRFLVAGRTPTPGGPSASGRRQDAAVIGGRVMARRNAAATPSLAGQGDGLDTLSNRERLVAMPYVFAARAWAQKRYWKPQTLDTVAAQLADIVAGVTNCVLAGEEVRRRRNGDSDANTITIMVHFGDCRRTLLPCPRTRLISEDPVLGIRLAGTSLRTRTSVASHAHFVSAIRGPSLPPQTVVCRLVHGLPCPSSHGCLLSASRGQCLPLLKAEMDCRLMCRETPLPPAGKTSTS